MEGLDVPDPNYVGCYRGEKGIENVRVWVGIHEGAVPGKVAGQLKEFENRLQRTLSALDKLYPVGAPLDGDVLSAVIDLAAWAHAEWVRIHPFANGNGRTARMWANAIFMRYGLDPVVRIRPRPDDGYGAASAQAMHRDWKATAVVFRKMLLRP
jgi:fido (protein-threonine AMPylation protein)